ncbi:hypothetical protein KY329_00385, partial [Candidatus Woesearchaeota archaeon]|nr:hypothetical protein [Candidatus Woesearchaeota archaeon]
MKKEKILFALALIILLVMVGCKTSDETPEESARIDLYVMSQCPYGIQAENAMPDVKEKLGEALELNIEYIGAEKDGAFASLHGQP